MGAKIKFGGGRMVSAEDFEASGLQAPAPDVGAGMDVSTSVDSSVAAPETSSPSAPVREAPLSPTARAVEEVVVRGYSTKRLPPLAPASGWTPTLYDAKVGAAIINSHRNLTGVTKVLATSMTAPLMIASAPISSAISLGTYAGFSEISGSPMTLEGAMFGLGVTKVLGPVGAGLGGLSGHSLGRGLWEFNSWVLGTGIGFAGPQ